MFKHSSTSCIFYLTLLTSFSLGSMNCSRCLLPELSSCMFQSQEYERHSLPDVAGTLTQLHPLLVF